MADDDNFDIDIYGDDAPADYQENIQGDVRHEDTSPNNTEVQQEAPADTMDHTQAESHGQTQEQDTTNGAENGDSHQENGTQQISSTGGSTNNQAPLHKQAPQQQGVKRKQGEDDDRPVDPGATAALMINELNWWISEEDIRGWANQSGCEDELIEVTFNEHKVNGKSKGQVYVHLETPQAATALKHRVEAIYKDQAHIKKPTAIFDRPNHNPFKTLPKDVPARDKGRGDRASSGTFGTQGGAGGGQFNRFNNPRGGFGGRGGQSNAGFNRNFSGPMGGNMGGGMGGFNAPMPMTNFGGPMGGMNTFNPGFNRGGMMGGMRGGMGARGGRGGNMGMNPMGGGMNMPMGGNMGMMGGGMMGMGGNMGMMGGMGGPGGFGGGQGHFNPAFFNQNPNMGGNDGNWNPHGAKRPRPE